MIFILSIETDNSTEDVIDWLRHYNQEFIRVNPDDIIKIEDLVIAGKCLSIKLRINDRSIDMARVKSFWYRRGDINLFDFKEMPKEADLELKFFLRRELGVIQNLLYKNLESKFHINKRKDNETNKLLNLVKAAQCGLMIPSSFVKNEVCQHEIGIENYITKGFYNGGFRLRNSFSIGAPTEKIYDSQNTKFPSFLQKEIVKKYEIRVFFLYEKTYSIAIFSQGNENTKIDFRNYDSSNPNRTVPFDLPKHIEQAISVFMKEADLNCGSLDFIYGEDNEFYFLEVNPIGQFQQVSIPANYHLDKLIAEKLISHE